MRCIRCGRETTVFKTVGGYAVGPVCFRKMFPAEKKHRINELERCEFTKDLFNEPDTTVATSSPQP